ncbi:MAG: T9SS type A sorting domain-containing protein [Saprospiraceae bacterium]|nr:T9SS type A sorting domain-containing protein [Saprospiraceae bacterium]
MRKIFSLIIFLLPFATTQLQAQGCTVDQSNIVELTNDGNGTCTYSIDILFTEGSGPDNRTLTFTATDATILTGAGPHSCACSGNTYTITLSGPCGGPFSIEANHDNSGNGSDCSVSTGEIILPVSWTNFDVQFIQPKVVEISWGTATEVNNEYFEVQQSQDGQNFRAIATIEGQGNDYQGGTYAYVHQLVQEGNYYFRIRQQDLDGAMSYTEIVNVAVGDKHYAVFPNPTTDVLHIIGNIADKSMYLIDSWGNVVRKTRGSKIDVASLVPGVYSLVIENGQTKDWHRFVKIR